MKNAFDYEMTIGRVRITEENGSITGLSMVNADTICNDTILETDVIRDTAHELREYLEGKRTQFTTPLNPKGTEFQKKVWHTLQTIPFGETWSYGQVARAIGNPKACRAVGMANNRNPIMIIIPCHRVIGTNGSLVGYGGGLPLKKELLKLENNERRLQYE